MHPVSTLVNKAGTNDPRSIEAVTNEPPTQGVLLS